MKLFALVALSGAAFAADQELWKYVPADATALSGIDVERTKNSPFGRYLMDQISDEDRGLGELERATGFDPRRDLRSVIVATGPTTNQAFFVVRGSFDQARILEKARREKANVFVYQGLNVIAKDETHWIAFLDSSSAVGGSAELVRAAIAQAKNPTPQPSLAKAKTLSSRYDAWVVSSDPAGGILKGIPANQNGDMLRSIRQASGGVRFGVNVEIEANATARSDRDATALHDAIRFVASMVRVKSEEQGVQAVNTLLDSMRLTASGDQVSLSLKLPEAELEKLIDSSRQRKQRVARAY